ncbi:ParA family protein [Streptosporangium sp. CA-115845]|uniref:ParA family protein n=1 Tax=Streptosporangium sp. CA-115845 TaxID=3240071 RepID=UPI003D8C42CC
MRITAVVNQKGGVGKTATTINLGGALAFLGQAVALVDVDPQGNLTGALKTVTTEGQPTLAAALLGQWRGPAAALAVEHSKPGAGQLDVIPHTGEMFTISRDLDKVHAREGRLARVLTSLEGEYDHILIDCPPALDIMTDNALVAADGVVIPVQAEDSSLRALELLLAQVDAIEDSGLRQTPLVIHGLVVSMLERGAGGVARSNIGRSVVTAFEGLPLPMLGSVPRGTPVTEAWRYATSVQEHAPESEHAEIYRALAKVLVAA